MTTTVLHYLNKHVLYNLLPLFDNKIIEMPVSFPFFELADEPDSLRTCTCCGWKGQEMKARKHYLAVETISELEFFCPDCNHYLGFVTEHTHGLS